MGRLKNRKPPLVFEDGRQSRDFIHVGDPARARDALGFEASTSFAEGLDERIAWSEAQEALDRVEASMAELEGKGLVG